MRHDTNATPACDTQKCRLPNCWCSKDGTRIPGNLTVLAVPQMIMITFDDAVNAENFELYSSKKPVFINEINFITLIVSSFFFLKKFFSRKFE